MTKPLFRTVGGGAHVNTVSVYVLAHQYDTAKKYLDAKYPGLIDVIIEEGYQTPLQDEFLKEVPISPKTGDSRSFVGLGIIFLSMFIIVCTKHARKA